MCIFCKIVEKEVPAFNIYEDDIVLAYMDIHPDSNGHTLVIPKKHYKDLDEIDEVSLNHLMKVVKSLKNKLEKKLNCDGITLVQNNGDVQEIKHFHMHIKPYYNKKQSIKDVSDVYKSIME